MNLSSMQSLVSMQYSRESTQQLRQTQHALASGRRLTHAAIDPAAMAMASGMDAESRSMGQALSNLGDATSVLQTAEGGLESMQSLQGRARELAVQGSSDTLGTSGRRAIQRELQQIEQEMGALGASTRWGDQSLLDGSSASLEIQAGPGSADQVQVGIGDVTPDGTAADGLDPTSSGDFRAYIDDIDARMESVGAARSQVGADLNRMEAAGDALGAQRVNTERARSEMEDVDYAQAAVDLATQSIQQQASLAMMQRADDAMASLRTLVG